MTDMEPGGMLARCPECNRLVNRIVNDLRCPYCRRDIFCEAATPV